MEATPTKCETCPLTTNCDGHAWFDGEFDHICEDVNEPEVAEQATPPHPCENCTSSCLNGWIRWSNSDYPCDQPRQWREKYGTAA